MAHHFNHAGVAELADAPDLGSGAARRGGSNPVFRSIVYIRRHSQVVRPRSAKPLFTGSNPVAASTVCLYAGVAELADAQDLKSCGR
jgi:hypothetical protein